MNREDIIRMAREAERRVMSFIESLLCAVFGHKYVVLRRFNPGARQVGCTRCNRQWAMHDGTRSFVPWDGEFEMMYRQFGEWK